MQFVKFKLDPDQFGGMKGNSINHYLIEMTNFILFNQDLKNPQATLAAFLDFKQGFNRCQHSIFIDIMAKDYNLPGWLLRILIGYLSGRKLRIRYKSKTGEEKSIFGGGGQGTVLGLWIFLFMIDKAGPKRSIQTIGQIVTQPINQRKPMDRSKKKWIDDFTVLTHVNLKAKLVPNPNPTRPVTYRGRTEQILPQEANILQQELDLISTYTNTRNMQLNPLKTKGMLFNPLHKWDFQPQLTTNGSDPIEMVEEYKILGYVMTLDLKTTSNTDYICQRAYRRMWILRRLKSLGCPTEELLDILRQQVISILEGGVPYWGPMISKVESNQLERCLKTGLHIIYQSQYTSFTHVLKLAKMESLKARRLKLITSFGKKAFKSEKHKDWFVKNTNIPTTQSRTRDLKPSTLLKPVPCRTQRFERSSIPFITKLLTWHPPLTYKQLLLN